MFSFHFGKCLLGAAIVQRRSFSYILLASTSCSITIPLSCWRTTPRPHRPRQLHSLHFATQEAAMAIGSANDMSLTSKHTPRSVAWSSPASGTISSPLSSALGVCTNSTRFYRTRCPHSALCILRPGMWLDDRRWERWIHLYPEIDNAAHNININIDIALQTENLGPTPVCCVWFGCQKHLALSRILLQNFLAWVITSRSSPSFPSALLSCAPGWPS